MKKPTGLLIFSLILLVVGFGLVWYWYSFKLMIAIFIILWGSNIDRSRK